MRAGELRLLDTAELPARRNLALSAALLAGGGEVLRLQRFPRAAIIGAHQRLEREVDLVWCAQHGVETARRMTGGGAIVMAPGMLGWELVLGRRRFPDGLGQAAGLICRGAAAGLARLGVAAEFRPRNDIVVDGRKLGGTGGYFDGDRLLFQGTVLIDPDFAFMARALRLPVEKLSATGAGFADRLVGLDTLLGRAVTDGEAGAALAAGLAEALGMTLVSGEPSGPELAAADRLHATEIGTDAFVRGQDLAPADAAPDAAAELAEPGGAVSVALRLRPGGERRIATAGITGDMFVTPPGTVRDLEAALRDIRLEQAEAAATRFLLASGAAMLGGDIQLLARAVGAAARSAGP